MTHSSHFALLVAAAFLGACERPAPSQRSQSPDSTTTDTTRQLPPPVDPTQDTGNVTAAARDTARPAPPPGQNSPPVASSDPRVPPPSSGTDTLAVSPPLHDAYHQAPLDTVDARTYQGWKYYNLHCARCHGEDASGTTIAPHLIPSLKPDGPIPDEATFLQTVCAGRQDKGMPAWCALGLMPAQIDTIYAYVKGRSDATLHPGRPARRAE